MVSVLIDTSVIYALLQFHQRVDLTVCLTRHSAEQAHLAQLPSCGRNNLKYWLSIDTSVGIGSDRYLRDEIDN